MKRFIAHSPETFLPNQVYTVDTDLAEIFVSQGYSSFVENPTESNNTFNNVAVQETKVEKEKRKRKGQD
jgi:hypothetical protein